MKLQDKIEKLLKETDATFGISIRHLQSGEEVRIRADESFQMASVFKVPILLALFEQVHEGRIDLTTRIALTEEERVPGSGILQELDPGLPVTVKDLATLMTIVSDNMAADVLLGMLGKDAVRDTARRLGAGSISIAHSCWELLSLAVGMEPLPYSEESWKQLTERLEMDVDEAPGQENPVMRKDRENNLCTPDDMTAILTNLAEGAFISPGLSESVLDILYRQQLNDRIPARLPAGTKVAHKTGTIASAVNDAGIIDLPGGKGPLIISIFSAGNPTTDSGEAIIARIAETAYQHFTK
ncbi:Extended-spectrum beta-lactamase PER-1 precursor [Bhargavaea cecembensis DSE10]|uniref:Extended-spectrum beta-lactamase PER-1 n=1 Tax=Bhargavaea cecembensis DSE10 TaxID=1235279 RepID=M7NHI5_9BACL|nr:serine hydrolase [Bhargavaea cecembensis]EMR06646.1 Extended-spectrum beta-lactamase PER-1 precursor [Bhargavaea cecembensis DSE10]